MKSEFFAIWSSVMPICFNSSRSPFQEGSSVLIVEDCCGALAGGGEAFRVVELGADSAGGAGAGDAVR